MAKINNIALCLLFLAIATIVNASDVVDLNAGTFDKFLKDEKLTLVEFYAPWCGHCKALAPQYEEAATQLKKDGVLIAKVNCEEHQKLCESQDVRGYPTLKVFSEGVSSEFKAARTSDAIVSYMRKKTLPAVSNLADKAAIEAFAAKERVVVVAFVESESSESYKSFEATAKSLSDEYVFAATTNADAAAAFEVSAPSIILFKQFDEGMAKLEGAVDSEALVSFVRQQSVPLVDDIGPENYALYVESGLPIAYYFFTKEAEKAVVQPTLTELAKKYRTKLHVVFIDASKYGGHARNLNVKEQWPAYGIHNAKLNLKYPFDASKDLTPESLAAFTDEVMAGDAKPSIKSEAEPENNDGPVTVVVGSSFEKIVLDTNKDVFVEFYASWCGYCKKLAPIWDELGEKYAAVSNVVIAKFLATDNDLPTSVNFQIEGFPTLKLFKAKTNEIVDYNGDRTLEGLVSFLEENAVNKGGVSVEDVKKGLENDESESVDEQDEL